MNKYSLIVVESGVYPKGCAPSNRIHLYCKAFRNAGGNPLYISLDAPFDIKQPFNYIGRYEGIPFIYSRKSYIKKKNFLKRNAERIFGLVNSLFIIYKHKRKNPNTIVLFFSTLPIDEFLLAIILKLFRVRIIKECNEAPPFIREGKKNVKFHIFFHKHLKLKSYDGIIVISDFLKEFYLKIYPEYKIFQIPILVDLDRFNGPFDIKKSDKRIITYIGALGRNKDGLDILLESVSRIRRSIDTIQLTIACNGSKVELKKLEDMIVNLELMGNVNVLVSVESKEIPVLLASSELLVLARPNNNQAKAGFPTKLGEYLASKKPVVITTTGEIPKYLVDKESAYLAEPGNVNDFAKKLLFALNDPDINKIGLEGFKVAEKYFDYRAYGKELMEICRQVTGLAN